ncbi:MAG: rod shape-determining protein MreC [Nitrospira bacterium HGW-Nitrospira-1]|nr:MAG: rod shape-determining protein MreC [Nitrospira bacterium HGW-Nitrospira-1]
MSKKNVLFFLLVLSLSFILMTYQSRKGNLFSTHFIDNILNASHAFTKSVTDSIASPFKKLAIRDEDNKLLRKRIDELLMERAKYQEAAIENKRLNELLGLRESRQRYVTAAKALSRGTDQWSHTLVLDKGQKEGVAKDMSAITPTGLAGKIFNVTKSYAKLLLLTDINFSAAVRLQESRREGIISGTGRKNLILQYIPYEEEIKTGDIVITSGLDQLFPPGIPVGFISKIDKKGTGHFQHIEVTPYIEDSKLEEVLIIK